MTQASALLGALRRMLAEPGPMRRMVLPAALAVLVLVLVAGFAWLPGSWPGAEPESSRIVAVYRRNGDDNLFLMGVRLAVADANAAGSRFALDEVEEKGYTDATLLETVVSRTLRLAASIARRPSLLAVIGHDAAATAVPASSVYERAGKLFLATHATTVSLTEHDFRFVFALQPSNADGAAIIARYALDEGMRRFVVLTDGSGYGQEVGSQFRRFSTRGGGQILHHGRLSSHNYSIDQLLLFILNNAVFKPADIDAIFIASSSEEDTIRFIRRARQLGLRLPILGPDYLFSNYIQQQVGNAAMAGVTAASTYAAENPHDDQTLFGRRFAATYGVAPDLMAAVGYDAIQLLAHAVKQAGSRDPAVLADTLRVLRYESPFIGVTGSLVFDTRGLVTDTNIYVVQHDGRHFSTVATYQKPRDVDGSGPAQALTPN